MRALWGEYDNSHRITKRRKETDNWIKKIMKNQFNHPFVTYVFGEDNCKKLTDKGFNCVLIDKNPLPFDALTEQYRHKLETLKYAFDEDGVDELIHLDWDVIPQKPLPNNFWDVLGKKEVFQSCLQLYHRRKATWSKEDMRKIPNGGFLYIRDKTVPHKIIKIWEQMKGPSAEPPMAKFTDNYIGGWQGIDKYWDLFEPDFCNLHKMSGHGNEKIKEKNQCLIHYQG